MTHNPECPLCGLPDCDCWEVIAEYPVSDEEIAAIVPQDRTVQ